MAHTEHNSHHVIPQKTLLAVFGGLVALTILTVLTAKFVDLGPLNVPLALAIAGTKTLLVVLFFMALRYDKPVNALAFSVGSVFVAVFLVFTLLDTAFRGDMGNVSSMTIQQEEAQLDKLRARDPDPSQLKVAPADYESDAVGADQGAAAASTGGSDMGTSDAASDDAASGDGDASGDDAPSGDDGVWQRAVTVPMAAQLTRRRRVRRSIFRASSTHVASCPAWRPKLA